VPPLQTRPPKVRTRPTSSLLDPSILRRAVLEAFVKLDPRTMIRNPVMFVVEIGSVITAVEFFSRPDVFVGLVTLWLWATVLFANFAEAVAEGRGKAQADTLRRGRRETMAHLLRPDGTTQEIPAAQLRAGNLTVVTAGQVVPGDGDVVEGMAVVDESAITGESAPVIRESGGDRSAVTGGTIDLDSNPTKLIEVVEVAKQLLITRGSLTTFSIANDVANYFAIIPPMFVVVYPRLQVLKIRAPQMKLIIAYVLALPITILIFGGISLVIRAGTGSILNPGFHGLTEVTYAYASVAQNNGSAFAGLAANTPWYDTTLGLTMLIGRFAPIVLALAIAGSLAGARVHARTRATLDTAGPTFVAFLLGVIVIVGGLIYFPMLILGPIGERIVG
jgi:Potassium-transporting ATPase A subunit/E1-E2 ATPase